MTICKSLIAVEGATILRHSMYTPPALHGESLASGSEGDDGMDGDCASGADNEGSTIRAKPVDAQAEEPPPSSTKGVDAACKVVVII